MDSLWVLLPAGQRASGEWIDDTLRARAEEKGLLARTPLAGEFPRQRVELFRGADPSAEVNRLYLLRGWANAVMAGCRPEYSALPGHARDRAGGRVDGKPCPSLRIHPETLTAFAHARSLHRMTQAERAVLYRFTRHAYEHLIDHGFLDEDDPIEMLDGLLLVKEPQHSPHRTSVLLVAKALERAFGEGWFVQTHSPINLDDRSEPEPDVCVVRGSPRDYVDAHPTRPALIVEVAPSGLRMARGRKARAYARAGITDYWIVNLVDRVLEVHREPARPGPARRHWGYVAIATLGGDATITPLAASTSPIRVADLLP